MMNPDSYLSRLALVLSILISMLVFWALPTILGKHSGNSHGVTVTTIRDMWEQDQQSLPVPTVLALSFTDRRVLRWGLFSALVVAGVVLEIRCRDKKVSGTYHSVHVLLATLWGACFLIGCLAPFMPL